VIQKLKIVETGRTWLADRIKRNESIHTEQCSPVVPGKGRVLSGVRILLEHPVPKVTYTNLGRIGRNTEERRYRAGKETSNTIRNMALITQFCIVIHYSKPVRSRKKWYLQNLWYVVVSWLTGEIVNWINVLIVVWRNIA